MTDFTPQTFRDAWVNPSRTGLNAGSWGRLVLQNTGARVFVRPVLPNLSGRTVLSAVLRAHVKGSWAAQTVTLTRVTSRWVEGRVTSANQPTVTTAGQVSVATGALSDGGVVEWDVTALVQLVADGTEFYGFRIATDAATRQTLYSHEAAQPAWEMEITVSDAPDVPSNLRPDGGAVPTAAPNVGWDFVDLGGESTEQAASRVQVDSPAVGVEPDAVAPDFDSGWVVNTDPHYDLAASSYVPPASPPQSTFWRVNVRDGDGNESGWSDWAEFTVSAQPSLVVDSPVGTFGDPTPLIQAHLSSGTVKAWKVDVTGPDRSDVRAGSGMQTGVVEWTVPFRGSDGRRVLTEGQTGWAHVRVWDTVDRAVAIGSPTYVETWVQLDLSEDALTAPTNLSVTQLGDGDPRHAWSWQRTEAAEAWLLQVDGSTVVRLEPEDVTESGGTYSWTDYGILPPLRLHTVSVVAVDNGGKKTPPASLNHQFTVKGVWIVPQDGGTPVQLNGGDVASWVTTDARATYETVTGGQHDVFYGYRARSGVFEGTLDARDEDVWASLRRLEDFRVDRVEVFQLVWGSQTIGVRLRDVDWTSSTAILPNTLEHIVRFGFVSFGD